MARDLQTDKCFRADHLVEGYLFELFVFMNEIHFFFLEKIEALLEDKALSVEKRKELIELEGNRENFLLFLFFIYFQLSAKLDEFDEHGLTKLIRELNIKSPETGNDLSDVYPFNLMFETKIGPTGKFPG